MGGYLLALEAQLMSEFWHSFPGERFAPDAEGPLQIEAFVEGVEDSFVVDMDDSLQEFYAVVLSLGVVVVLLKFYAGV